MRIDKVLLVFRKDWVEISRNWQVLVPIIFVPLIFAVFLPIIILIPSLGIMPSSSLSSLKGIIDRLPYYVRSQLIGMNDQQILTYIFTVYFLAPFFLIIPLMASSVLASDSFAGEKERKTIEALLATPLSDSELLLGKILVAFIPSIAVTILSFILYSIIVDILSYNIFNGRILLPNMIWIMIIFILAPTVAFASIGLTVMISSKVKGFREAHQISVVILIPILVLVFGQVLGVIFLGPLMIMMLAVLFLIIDLILFYLCVKLFGREKILSRIP